MTPATWADGDLNGDGTVSIADFIELASQFGQSIFAAAPAQAPQASSSATAEIATDGPLISESKHRSRKSHHHRNHQRHVLPQLLLPRH